MSDENTEEGAPESKRSKVKTVVHVVDRGTSAAEAAGTAFSAVKWVSIAIVSLVFLFLAWGAYKIVSKPAAAIGDAVEGASGAMKSGTEKVKSGTADLKNRLQIEATNPAELNMSSEEAFARLSELTASEPGGIKDKLFRKTNFPGSENKICQLSLGFGDADLPVFLAADNDAYATAKALGSNDDRMIRILIQAGDDDLALNTVWDPETESWILKWKATTVKKPVSDALALQRALDILKAAKDGC